MYLVGVIEFVVRVGSEWGGGWDGGLLVLVIMGGYGCWEDWDDFFGINWCIKMGWMGGGGFVVCWCMFGVLFVFVSGFCGGINCFVVW